MRGLGRSISFAVLLALVSAGARGAVEPTPVKSAVERVLLYSDRALVIRSAKLDVPAGRSHVSFEGLPGKLFDAHVAVELRGGKESGVVVANIEIEPVYETTFRKKEAKDAMEQLKALRAELRALKDRREVALSQVEFARQVRIGARPAGKPEAEQYLPLAPEAWAVSYTHLRAHET